MDDSPESESNEGARRSRSLVANRKPSDRTSSPARRPSRKLSSPYARISDPTAEYSFQQEAFREPEPIQVVVLNRDRKFEVDVDALNYVLLQENVREKSLVVVAIAGDYRKGKSFMMNFFLRYLERKGAEDWMGDKDKPLTGFKWRGGCDRETTGIWLWSETFCVQLPGGKEVGIILMDTQGTFDSDFKFADNAVIFALSAMTSSVLIYNLMHNLQEDNLHVLEFFVDYGRLALEATKAKPFQKLVFLIRDWSYPYDYKYGLRGGKKFLQKKLAIRNGQPKQLKRVRRHIENCFKEISCFLMPHPGIAVASDPEFRGALSAMDKAFVDHLKEFVEATLKTENLVVKQINGLDVTGVQMIEYFKVYANVFNQENMPEPKTMLEATAEANNLAAVAAAKTYYIEHMEGLCGGNKPFIYPSTLDRKHLQLLVDTKNVFETRRKMGGQEFSTIYLQKLEEEIKQLYEHYAAHNRSKSFYGVLGTPITIFLLGLISLASARIFEILYLGIIGHLVTYLSIGLFATLGAYVLLRSRGHNEQLVKIIDELTEKFFNLLLSLLYRTYFS